ncbi:MAG: hypothetical protein VX438_07805 [Planctomycetota bacterium]|nr:hypothetical protein [Planctomycetota bacterium]
MSEENSSEDATGKVEALEREYAAFKSAMAKSKNTRIAILVGAIALVAIIGYNFYSLGRNLMSDEYQGKILRLAQERWEQKKEGYMKQALALVDTAAPKLKEAFYQQIQQDLPKYQAAFGMEREAFTKAIEDELRAQVKKQYEGALATYKDRLAKEFPELETQDLKDQALQAIGEAYDQIVEDYYVKGVSEGLEKIYGLWDGFPKSQESKPGEKPEEVLIGLLLQLVSMKMAN